MIRFLLKGLLRDKSRSLFPFMTVTAGVFLVVFFYSYFQGVLNDFVNYNSRLDTGHVKIVTKAYRRLMDQAPNDLAILGTNSLLKILNNYEAGLIWVPRIRFGGLLDIPDENGETRAQSPIRGLGVELINENSHERKILNLEKIIVSGRLPVQSNEILMGEELARKLKVRLGDSATLLSSTMHGAMAIYNFKISGMVRLGISHLDKSYIIVDIKEIQNVLDMEDGASEILGFSRNLLYNEEEIRKVTEKLNKKFSNENDDFSPVALTLWEQGGLGEYLEVIEKFRFVIVNLFVIVMSVVIWNSGLLNGIRRYGEIGVRMAMGEPKGKIYGRMIYESIMIGLAGSIAGTLLGVLVSYYLQEVGWDISGMLQKSTALVPDVIRARVTTVSFFIGFIPGLLASVIGTMFAGLGIYKRQTAQLFKELEV